MSFFIILISKTCQPPFRGWLITYIYNVAKSRGNLSKGATETGNGKVLVDKYQTKDKICKWRRENCGDLFRKFNVLPLIDVYFLSGLEDMVVVSQMARNINLQAVSFLLAVQFSEKSGLVKDVKAAESILREYETATTTRFSQANMGFGNKYRWEVSIHKNWNTFGDEECISICFVLNYFCSTNKGIGGMRRHRACTVSISERFIQFFLQ